jgi:hypothetical protein
MARKIVYWVTTGIVALLSAFAGYSYLAPGSAAAQGFTHVGYPQQLRVILAIAKPLGAIVLVIPRFPKLKEWAYAGFTFAWICAVFAHYLAKDGAEALAPVVLLILLSISYVTRPASRRL